MGKKVLLLGGLGNASVIGWAMVDANQKGYTEYEFAGYVNDRDGVTEIEGFPVLGGIKDIPRLLDEGFYFINTIYKVGVQKERIELFNSLNIPDERLATFIHPESYIAPNVEFSPGCVIMPNVSVSSGTIFGKCCRVMVGATIGHNSKLGAHSFFAANCCTGAYLNIGLGVTISLSASIREYVKIRNYSTVGMGSVVLKDIGENEIWVGNPAIKLR